MEKNDCAGVFSYEHTASGIVWFSFFKLAFFVSELFSLENSSMFSDFFESGKSSEKDDWLS